MRFSVVIAAYNAAETLGEALSSVLAQTFEDFEVIVVDDGSTDATAALATSFGESDARVRVERQSNGGPSAARNRGIAIARGECISVVDSDDLWLPTYLEEMDRALRDNPDAGFAYTDAWGYEEASGRFYRGSAMSPQSPPTVTLEREQFVLELLRRNFVFNSVTMRREVLERVGGYNGALSHCEDYELWLRIAIAGYPAARAGGGPLAISRDRPGSLSHNGEAMRAGRCEVFRRVATSSAASTEVKTLARAQLSELEASIRRQVRQRQGFRGRLMRGRDMLAAATRGVRHRRLLRSSAPAPVAASFPRLALDPRRRHDGASDPDAAAEAPPDALGNVVARGVGLAGIGYVLSQALTFAAYFVLAKLADPSQFGTFAAGTVVVGVGTLLGESGMVAALIHRRGDLEESFNSAFLATIAGGTLLTLLCLGAAPLVGLFFHNHKAELVAAVMSGWMLLRLSAVVPDASLQRRFSFLRRVVIDPLSAVAFAAGSIPAAAAGLGVWSLVIGTYASALVNAGAAWAFTDWRPHLRLASVRIWRELARYGRPVVGAEFIRRIVAEIPVALLGRISGVGALGQFTYASRVAAQPLGAVISVGGYVLLPAFARLAGHEERFRAAVKRSLRWLCITSFPVGLLLVPFGTPAVVLVFGEQWRGAGHGAMALAGYCAALSLDSIASEAWKAYGRPDMLPRMHGVSLALTVVCVGGLATFGLIGVTIGMSLSAIGVGAYAIRGMSRVLGMPLSGLVEEVWPPALAAAVMAGGLFCLEHFVVRADHHGAVLGLSLLLLEAVLGAIVYLAALAALAPASARELSAATRGAVQRLVARGIRGRAEA